MKEVGKFATSFFVQNKKMYTIRKIFKSLLLFLKKIIIIDLESKADVIVCLFALFF